MNIEDLLAELEGTAKKEDPKPTKQEIPKQSKQEKPAEECGPVLRTLPARSRDVVCGICRKKLKPSEKYWCQSSETTNYWWCCSCLK
jgi:hypothetical protein